MYPELRSSHVGSGGGVDAASEGGRMKIVEVSGPFTYWVVETDTDEWPVYRRNGAGDWENLMGESWEPSYFGESALEALFQAWISDGNEEGGRA